MTTTANPDERLRAGGSDGAPAEPATARGHIGRVVAGTLIGGLVAAIFLVAGPLAGRTEHVIAGAMLLAFAAAWAALAALSDRWTDQPQGWANVPAVVMALAGITIFVLAPTGNEAGWVWPPALVALVAWMTVRVRRSLRSRTRFWIVYPLFAALLLAALGGFYETYKEGPGKPSLAMPGRLVGVGDHKLHIKCTGSGSPTVVLEPGLGEVSSAMGLIAPAVASTTRVCVYDRAGRGWSESAGHPLDGKETATELHTLLARADEHGPFVLAGHSAGGIYVMNFAALFPHDVAGVVLLDSMSPEQYQRIDGWPAFYEMYRRASAVVPILYRFGVGRAINASSYADLPKAARDQEREFLSTPRYARSVRDEFSQIRTAMTQARALTSLGDRPLVVLTALSGAQGGWVGAQDQLAKLSTNSAHRTLRAASHSSLVEDRATAKKSTQAILDTVTASRTGASLTGAASVAPLDGDATLPVTGGQLHIRCSGSGNQTVVLIPGYGDVLDRLGDLQNALSAKTRVCSYERFGIGTSTSTPANAPQTFRSEAAALHEVLAAAHARKPYVLVGHSLGGPEAMTFASRYRLDTAGVLLLDGTPPNWLDAQCGVRDNGSPGEATWHSACEIYGDPDKNPEHLDGRNAYPELANLKKLGSMPLIALSAINQDRAASGLSPDAVARLNRLWHEGEQMWAALSSDSSLRDIESSHYIYVDHEDLVTTTVLDLLARR